MHEPRRRFRVVQSFTVTSGLALQRVFLSSAQNGQPSAWNEMKAGKNAPGGHVVDRPQGQIIHRADLVVHPHHVPLPQIEETGRRFSSDSCIPRRPVTNFHVSTSRGFQGARCFIDRHRSLHRLRILQHRCPRSVRRWWYCSRKDHGLANGIRCSQDGCRNHQ